MKDVIPYLIGEDPERIEYLWQSCLRRRGADMGMGLQLPGAKDSLFLWDFGPRRANACIAALTFPVG